LHLQASAATPAYIAPPREGGAVIPNARGVYSSSQQDFVPPAGRTLEDYLSLPVEEYALLDPKYICREATEEG
jgi:hypothetical protein